jgi:hypothetical protein
MHLLSLISESHNSSSSSSSCFFFFIFFFLLLLFLCPFTRCCLSAWLHCCCQTQFRLQRAHFTYCNISTLRCRLFWPKAEKPFETPKRYEICLKSICRQRRGHWALTVWHADLFVGFNCFVWKMDGGHFGHDGKNAFLVHRGRVSINLSFHRPNQNIH